TFIAVNLLKRIADAGQLRRALFVCDRDELRAQGLAAFQNVFGNDAAAVSGNDPQKNARILVATYQTLNVDREDADASFLLTHYPEDYFSHIVIDECHRSAWGKWSQVLKRNPAAVQVGLTATPRRLKLPRLGKTAYARTAAQQDARLIADNIRWFGKPAYEYTMAQGIEDGYLAACELYPFDLFHDNKAANERVSGLGRADLDGKTLVDANTGEILTPGHPSVREHYEAQSFEDRLLLPERVAAMCQSLFAHLVENGGPEQKTIIFCARDRHADAVAVEMNNLYANWCAANNHPRIEEYAFKCTAAASGSQYLADLRGASRRYFVATTVDLLTTGVDVPCVRNIVFFKYVRSPIAFYQMVGRGTRLYPPDGKLMFRVYDYTDATRLFGEEFLTRAVAPRARPGVEPPPPEPVIRVEGLEVRVTPAGRYIVTEVDGQAMPVTVEEYKERLAARLVAEAPTLEAFRQAWVTPQQRRELLARLPDAGRSASVVRELEDMSAFDLYDVLAELGYGLAPKTRAARADAFGYKHAAWLAAMPRSTAEVLRAIAGQFTLAGTEGLENPAVFQTPQVVLAGGLAALKALGKPA
ncbi:MAG: restriction endonuclease subunit R, partial [Chloroflexi bacterium]|nr:restriction endonuclease subunit R [Chloroflexota bacterium]